MANIMVLIAGILFGAGLTISQMINPNKVQNFLDITGQWDPSLLFVMVGALLIAFLGYRFVLRRTKPILNACFYLPEKKEIDKSLMIGSALFGIGWGLGGYCPGPGIASLGLLSVDAAYFVVGMIIAAITTKLFRL
jgi:uncharacterized membrane protein YedE/YeeE